MTNLTEQWKKGELPSGWYYVRLIRGEHHIDLYINSKNEWIDCPDNIIDTVVCEVPSYEEWEDLKSKLQLKETSYDFDTARLEEENTKLKKRNDSLNNRDINLCRIANGIRDENFALKELLKECKERLIYCTISTQDVQAKINQVLGEE